MLADILRSVLYQTFPRLLLWCRLCTTIIQQRWNLCSHPLKTLLVTRRHLQEMEQCGSKSRLRKWCTVVQEVKETLSELLICCNMLQVISCVASVEFVWLNTTQVRLRSSVRVLSFWSKKWSDWGWLIRLDHCQSGEGFSVTFPFVFVSRL